MPFCALLRCTNTSKNKSKDAGVTFHRFPARGHEKLEAWTKFVQKNRSDNQWLPNDYSYICSTHFKEEDKYLTKAKRVFLKKSAVPQIVSNVIVEPTSDSEPIFDTHRNRRLTKMLAKETVARKLLAIKFQKSERQNRYYKKKCHSYISLLNRLKTKFGFDSPSPINFDMPPVTDIISTQAQAVEKTQVKEEIISDDGDCEQETFTPVKIKIEQPDPGAEEQRVLILYTAEQNPLEQTPTNKEPELTENSSVKKKNLMLRLQLKNQMIKKLRAQNKMLKKELEELRLKGSK